MTEPIPDQPETNVKGSLPPLTQKSRRWGERIVEAGIYAVAMVSIVAIFLIFLFVFREAAPVFLGKSGARNEVAVKQENYDLPGQPGSATDTATAGTATSTDQQEVYNPGSGDRPEDLTAAKEKKSTATDTGKTSTDQQEVYNPGSGDRPEDLTAGKDTARLKAGSAVADTTETAGTAPDRSGEPVYNKLGQQIYNPESGDAPETILTAEDSVKLLGILEEDKARAIIGPDYPILRDSSPVKLSYLFYNNWQPNSDYPRYGIYSILIGTFETTLIALLIGTPMALLAALYTAFFAPVRIREWIKPVLELLASFPSVVLGFFCMMTIASIMQSIFGNEVRLNALVGGIGLSLAIFPIIYTLTEDALKAVPKSLREAALAMGATEWQAAYRVMLPAATPGIFAAVLLGFGRAMGETMIALMATGNGQSTNFSIFESVRTIAATIGAEMGEVVFGSPHYSVLFVLGIILFIFSFIINFITEFYIKERFIKRFRGGGE